MSKSVNSSVQLAFRTIVYIGTYIERFIMQIVIQKRLHQQQYIMVSASWILPSNIKVLQYLLSLLRVHLANCLYTQCNYVHRYYTIYVTVTQQYIPSSNYTNLHYLMKSMTIDLHSILFRFNDSSVVSYHQFYLQSTTLRRYLHTTGRFNRCNTRTHFT